MVDIINKARNNNNNYGKKWKRMDKVFFSCEYVCRLLHLAVCESERISLLCVEISDKQRATNEINRFGVCVCVL